MRKGRCCESQVTGIRINLGAGRKKSAVAQRNGVSGTAMNKWKSKYSGRELGIGLTTLRNEADRLRELVFELGLATESLEEIVRRKGRSLPA
jgi:hypothetical protein